MTETRTKRNKKEQLMEVQYLRVGKITGDWIKCFEGN